MTIMPVCLGTAQKVNRPREVGALASRISQVHETANRVLVVTNPSAGARLRHDAIAALVNCLEARGLKAQLVLDLKVLGERASRYHAAGELRTIIAAGGDGTVAEVVNRTAPDVPITVYPLGTANLLATYFQISRSPEDLVETVLEGTTVRLDAGRANGRIFLLMAGCGFDADVVERLHRRRNGRHISYWTYAGPILEAIRSYEYPDLRAYCETEPGAGFAATPMTARWAFVVNLPCYAGGLNIAPKAVGTDGQLDACLFGHGSLWHGLRYLGYVALGRHHVLEDHRWERVTRVRLESDKPVPYQLDGDPGGTLPLEIEVLPERLTLMAPRKRVIELGMDVKDVVEPGAGAR